jgi:predicted ATPase/class 3 adenylate cyclase
MKTSAGEGLPTGTVTFLFTDVAGSTALWEADPEAARTAMIRHDELTTQSVAASGGVVVRPRGEGDSHFAVYDQAPDAIAGALRIAEAQQAEPWATPRPLEVRMAVHTGVADLREGDYYGPEVNRCARLRGLAHPGQILVSGTTAALVRGLLPPKASLVELGWHRLRNVAALEQVFQLSHPSLPTDFPHFASADNDTHLPASLSSFVGRNTETAEVKRLVKLSRLLTLTGSGGVGKSRLAFQVAADLLAEYPDDAFIVDLAPLSNPALVPQHVLSALGVAEEPGRSQVDTLVAYLAGRRLLLLLDGCEHLLEACAALAEMILRSCPHVRILATSREPLRIGGEMTWRVPSLSIPDSVVVSSSDDATRFDAVSLFIERARQSKPDFAVDKANVGAVVQVCRRLDGIPLALELAAVRVKVLSCEQIAERLDDRFRLLTSGARDALPRHQTLRAAVDWSYDLLDDSERALFLRLSVFQGGFAIEAAEAVCSSARCETADVLDQLARLVDKSLILVDERAGRARYRLLETLRQYGMERLAAAGEQDEVHGRLLSWALAQAKRAEPELKGPNQSAFLDLLEDEHDNMRAALTWAFGHLDAGDGRQLSVLLSRFWLVRGYLTEGRHWLGLALAASPLSSTTPRDRAKVLVAASTLAWHQGDYAGVGPLAEEALQLSRESGDTVGIAEALCRLGELATMIGDHKKARSLFEESRAAWTESGAMRGVIQSMNVPLHDLATIVLEEGDLDRARDLFEEALAIAKEHGNTTDVVFHLSGLGNVARCRGDHEAARALYEESHQMAIGLGYKRMAAFTLQYMAGLAFTSGDHERASSIYREALGYFGPARDELGIVRCFEGLAKVAALTGKFDRTSRLAGCAEALRHAMRSPIPPSELDDYEWALKRARAGLGDDVFEIARSEGRRVEVEDAVRYALADS